jgi:hypothetical protein
MSTNQMLNISGILSQNQQTNSTNPATNQQAVASQHQYPHGAQANQNHNPSSPLLSNKIVNSPFLQSLFPQVNPNSNQGGAAAHHGTANMS